MIDRTSCGIRRRREENTTDVDVEELDSEVMRQQSYYQRYNRHTNHKRQRTLAEQLNDLCLYNQQEIDGNDVEMEEEYNRENNRDRVQMIKGDLPTVKGMVFGTSRHRTMDRMFRQYANEYVTRIDPSIIRGDELVVYRPPQTFSLFTPEQIQELRARHHRKKNLESSIERFEQIDESNAINSCEDLELEMCVDVGQMPHLAGTISHQEWFLEDTNHL